MITPMTTVMKQQRRPRQESLGAEGNLYGANERERRILEHQYLAKRMAKTFNRAWLAVESLESVAMLALIKAADRFDPARGVPFRHYAAAVISGGIKHYLRDCGRGMRVPRGLHERHAIVNRADRNLRNLLGRAPNVRDIAEETGLSEEDVLEAMEVRNSYRITSLHTPLAGGRLLEGCLASQGSLPNQLPELIDLKRALENLDSRQQLILHLKYGQGRSQHEIAMKIGCSQVHVSRLLHETLGSLRRCLRK